MIFLGEFLHCGYKRFLKKLGKFVSIVRIREKNAQKMDKVYKLGNREKKGKKKKKTLVQRYIYVHSK
jgi:hypothetical protein